MLFLVLLYTILHPYSIATPSCTKSLCNMELVNLDTYVNLFGDCIFHISNYQGVNILSLSLPIILSRHKSTKTSKASSLLVTYEVPKFKIDIMGPTNSTDEITRDFTIKNKNWMCTTLCFLYLQFNEKIEEYNNTENSKFKLPQVYINYGRQKHLFDTKTTYYFERRPHQTYCVLVIPPIEVFSSSFEDYALPWIQAFSDVIQDNPNKRKHKFQYFADLFILETTFVKNSNLLPSSTKVNTSSLWYFCRYCKPCNLFAPRALNLTSNRKHLDYILKKFNSQSSVWLVYHPWADTLWVHQNPTNFQDLTGHRLRFPKNKIHPNDSDYAITYLNQALSHIIMGNHSFTVDIFLGILPSKMCYFPNVVDNTELFPSLMFTEAPQTDFLVPEDLHPFRFISCGGQPRMKRIFSFQSLYNSFDIYTWLLILVLYFVVVIILNLRTNVATILFSNYAILLEQSQSYNVRLVNKSHLFIYGSLVLTGILLSNAYKGDNITRLTLPIVPIPYEKLDELVRHMFTFYQLADRINNLEFSFKITMPPMVSKRKQKRILADIRTINLTDVLNMLKVCDENKGVAVFEPEAGVFKQSVILRNYSHISWGDVGVGTELFSGIWRGLKVNNNVDFSINKRGFRFFETGIITQWLEMWSLRMVHQGQPEYMHYAKNELERKLVERRNITEHEWSGSLVLNGSIITLFVFLGGSQLVALGCLLGEAMYRNPHLRF